MPAFKVIIRKENREIIARKTIYTDNADKAVSLVKFENLSKLDGSESINVTKMNIVG